MTASAIAQSMARTEAIQACVREARAAGDEKIAERALALSIRELYLRQKLADLRRELVFGVIGVEEWATDHAAEFMAKRGEAVQ